MKPLTLIDKAFLLKKTQLFKTLDLDFLLTISDKMELGEFRRESTIFQVDQDAHRLYVIATGSILIKDKRGQHLAELGSGEFFGDESIFNDQPRGYEAIARTDALLLSLSRAHILSIISECPAVAISLLEAYTAHIRFRNRL